MLNKKEAKKQFNSMKPFEALNLKDRTVRVYSKSQIDILLDVIYSQKHEDMKDEM